MDQVLFGIVIIVMLTAAFWATGLAASKPVAGPPAPPFAEAPESANPEPDPANGRGSDRSVGNLAVFLLELLVGLLG